MKRNDMEEKDIFYIKNPSANLELKADNSVLVLNMHELLELQDKYTTLQTDCIRLLNQVINLSNGYPTDMIKSDNDNLNYIARIVKENFMPIKTRYNEI